MFNFFRATHSEVYQPLSQAIDSFDSKSKLHAPLLVKFTPPAFLTSLFVISLVNKFTQLVSTLIDVGYLLFNARRYNFIFIREFFTPFVFLFSPILFPIRNKLIFVVNHNFQAAENSPLHAVFLFILNRFNFKFLYFEIHPSLVSKSFLLSKLNRANDLVIPFPIFNRFSDKKSFNNNKSIGIVGFFRDEKNDKLYLDAIINFSCRYNIDVILASPSDWLNNYYPNLNYQFILTESAVDYYNSFNHFSCVFVGYSSSSYFLRTSGIISDAISTGCPVLSPSFPIFHSQVHSPIQCGFCFNDVVDLNSILYSFFVDRSALIPFDNFLNYIDGRSSTSVSSLIRLSQ